MISAPVGSRFAVAGSSNAIVNAGPTPGSTPIAVPSVTPRNPHARFFRVSATAKPDSNALNVSMLAPPERTPRQTQAKTEREYEEHDGGENDRDDRVAHDPLAAEAARDEHEQHR